jgi:hypothetical protein
VNDTLHIEFDRPRNGSMLSRIRAEERNVEIWASYIPYDSIADLAGAVSLVLKGGPEAKVSWNEEPTEFDFNFVVEGEIVRLFVLRFPDSSRAKAKGTEVLRVTGSQFDICLPFWRALRRLESMMPPNEFKAAWGHRFPDAKVREIASLMEQSKSRNKEQP